MYRKKSYLIFSLLFLMVANVVNAQIRDSLVIAFTDESPITNVGGWFVYTTKEGDSVFTYTYNIKLPDKTLTLVHFVQSPKTIEYFGGNYENPITKIVDKSYLKGKRILDISFFKRTPYKEIEALFTGKNRPFIFLYEIGESQGDKIILKEVGLMGHLKI